MPYYDPDRLHLRGLPLWAHAWVWGSFVLLTLALLVAFLAYRDVSIWDDFVPARELANPAYAEAVYPESIFRTRANTWSNLAFVFVGLYAIALAVWDMRRAPGPDAPYVVQQPVLSLLFGVACCYLGFGSGIFHASLTRWGQQLDVAAMYSPLVVIVAIHWARWVPRIGAGPRAIPTWPVFAAAVVVISALLYVYKWELSSRQVMLTLIALIGTGCALDAVTRRFSFQLRWLTVAFISLVVAYWFRQMDVEGKLTGPDAWYQGHSVWHVLTSVTLGAMVLLYRSDQRTTSSAKN